MATKHEQIMQHILSLEIGHKISVRRIAKSLNVSEGTAYRAIKDAETRGIVSTIERVGTVRIEEKKKDNFEQLTFAEVIKIVDGQVLGGRTGLHKTLSKFVIGAMQLNAMMQYTEAGSLLIVGNRVEAHELALYEGAAVLITGGFDTAEDVKRLADEIQLPVMSTSYDTFTVATMINRAIYDQLIKREIVSVGDIYTPYDHSYYLYTKDKLGRWYELNEQSTHTRYPVVDEKGRVAGIVTSKDVIGKNKDISIEKLMTKNPMVVQDKSSLANVAHMMVWEGIELVPVADESDRLKGVISRQDVLKALQESQRQPQMGQTIDDIIASSLVQEESDTTMFRAQVSPQMSNQLGTLSNGVYTSLMTEAAGRLLRYSQKGDLVVENLTVYFLKPVQIDANLLIKPVILDAGRSYAKVDVEVFNGQKMVGKGILMAQLMNR
ncbi:CBS domain-containing protein [Lentibacillus halophilus]|uniref:CBS domain-containing protein n=1 Tax=Lentibacillus halophilus TaxID=295065 RepID=A0ABN0Z242_9BACI